MTEKAAFVFIENSYNPITMKSAEKKNFMNMSNARLPEQLKKMKELQKAGVCLFCKRNFIRYQTAPVIREKKWWLIRKNDYPYDGSRIHLLLIYKKHINSVDKISKNGMIEFLDHVKWVKNKFKIPGSTFLIRSGDNKYTGATITHLHAHIVSGYK